MRQLYLRERWKRKKKGGKLRIIKLFFSLMGFICGEKVAFTIYLGLTHFRESFSRFYDVCSEA
jgi:hypothetical protein